jgi:hypothetical protein
VASDHFTSLQKPYSGVVGASSPVQHVIGLLCKLVDDEPAPRVAGGRSSALLLATHVVLLLRAAGQLNAAGFHSPAAALFRPIEDALDCFAAVSLVDGCAEAWENGHLKASEAAKKWTENPEDQRNVSFLNANLSTIAEYRKALRLQYNDFAHCHPRLANWNVYGLSLEPGRWTLRLNTAPNRIARNAHAIDAHLTASILELLDHVERAYASYFRHDPAFASEFADAQARTEAILLEHSQNG